MIADSLKVRRVRVRRAGVLALGLAALAAGCGDDGLGARYPVSGKVTYKGEPVATGSISFYPAGGPSEEQRGAVGVIKDGYYTVSTQGDDDGAFPGEYLVTVTGRAPDMSKAKENAAKIGGMMRQDDIARAYSKAKSGVPRKYESPDAGLKAKVEPRKNTFDFELTD